jgi:hypothetical protein
MGGHENGAWQQRDGDNALALGDGGGIHRASARVSWLEVDRRDSALERMRCSRAIHWPDWSKIHRKITPRHGSDA